MSPVKKSWVSGGRRMVGALTVTLGVALVAARGDSETMAAAPAGVSETGAPNFVVLGPEALGLSSSPTDLDLLPDGRILVTAQREIAFGDGVRWETFREANDLSTLLVSAAVDRDGGIYTGIDGGIARIDLSEGERWHLTPMVKLPAEADARNATLTLEATVFSHWYWYGGNGTIVSWRPGQAARVAGHAGAVGRIFDLENEVYVSDESSGGLVRLRSDGTSERVAAAGNFVSGTVSCAVEFAAGQLLVGTGADGMKLFDGKTFRPFGPPGLLNNGHRITDVCLISDGVFAAAVDTVGIVFFDREGHTVQVLGRVLDHRLARVQLLRYAPNGVLWALLDDGVARVEYPSAVSHFEPLLASGLAFVEPRRHAGRLWLIADGRAMRGIYDSTGQLERFEDDTPPGRYLFTLAELEGQLFGCNDAGIFVYEAGGWRLVLPGIVNARLGAAASASDSIYYVARGEFGVIQHAGPDYSALRIPLPELGDSYNVCVDQAGIGWIELGSSRVGRLDPNLGKPSFQIFGTADGLARGWVEIFVLDGIARFHMANQLLRFDAAAKKFVEDRELLSRLPQLATAGGRPVTDSFGRLWFTANGMTQVIDRSATGGNRPVKVAQVGFAPSDYTAESDGVVWMFVRRRLARIDLRLPPPTPVPPQALITSVEFSASGRQVFAPGAALAPLAFADNSLVIHFVAPANPFTSPITFDVLLEGAGTQWVSTGAVGSAAFNRLKEGAYVFRVRPVAGGVPTGVEARLQFTVRPPWFRTPVAWTAYIVATVVLLAFIVWLPAFQQRRRSDRLERLVTERTRELNATNTQLGRQIQETTVKSAALSVSEERYRLLNAELEDRVSERTAKLAEASGLLEAMLENSPDLIYFKDRTSRFVRFSKACLPGFGMTEPEQLRGKTDSDLLSPEQAEPALADEREIIRSGQPIINKLERDIYPDRHTSWALTTKMPWRDPAGVTIGTFGITKDITALKEAEVKLAYERDQLRALLDSVPDTIYFKDTEYRFVLVSRSKVHEALARQPDLRERRAARGLPVDVPESELLTGLTDFDTLSGDDARLALEDEQQIVRSGEALIGKLERQVFLNGAVFWSMTSKMPWRGQDGKTIGIFGISKDVTDVKKAEEKLGQMHQQLIETSRMAGMAEVATGVLHNVGNVLNSVNVSATLVADQVRHSKAANLEKISVMLAQHRENLSAFLTDDPKGRIIPVYLATLVENLAAERKAVIAELENLRKNIEHIKEIVAMQQNYAKTSGVNETVSVPDLVEDALRINTGSLVRHDVDIARDYIARPVATLDKHKVIQILINLIRNAKYACGESGRPDKLITVRTTADSRHVRIEVIDNGVGIPEANLARIFNHGFTTRKHGHGFGLHSGALAARELGGSLTVRSGGTGHGATFTLELPFKPEPPRS